MSHELRTPVNAIHGCARLLAKPLPQARKAACLAVVQYASESLLTLVNHQLGLAKTILNAAESHSLITHGTDTMTTTPCALSNIPAKTIVFTGALLPARFRDNDAIFNIGFALAAVQALPSSVFIAMNGRTYNPHQVRKDRAHNRFVEIDPSTT